MNKPKLYFIIGIVILAVVVEIAWYKISPSSMKSIFSPKQAEEREGLPAEATKGGIFPTRQEVPKDVVVPEPESTGQKDDVAIPKTSVPAAPGVEAKLRTFEITATAGKYSPSTIIVRIGDTVHIDFKAIDDTYDIVFPDYGLRQLAKKGETKIIEFQATTDGQFAFYCENACPKGKMTGVLIITSAQ